MFQETNNEVVIYYLAGTIFTILLISAVIFYVFLHQKKVNAFRLQLQHEAMKHRQAIYIALQEGEEKERNRIAEELHDGISAKLSGLNMNLDYLSQRITNEDDKVLIDNTIVGIRHTIDELRDMSHNLSSAFFFEESLYSSLYNYIEQLNSKKEVQYSLFFEANMNGVGKTLALHCYRIITELLFNIYKHANATLASIQLTRDDDTLEIIVEDNGKGFHTDKANFKGIGLANVTNKVSLYKGEISIDSSNKGTTIIIELPINSL